MSAPEMARLVGTCHAVLCFDVGFQIDLDAMERRLGEASRLRAVRVRRPAPAWFEYQPPPVSVTLPGEPVAVGKWAADAAVEALVYDFGGVAIRYRIPFDDTPASLVDLGAALYDHEGLLADAQTRVERLCAGAGDAITKPAMSALTEDYVAYAVRAWKAPGAETPAEFVEACAADLSRLLQAERGRLSAERSKQTLSARIGYSPDDLSIVDWNAAILFDPEPEDILAVLTHANIELLEMRWLDDQLDGLLDRAHDLMARVGRRSYWPGGQTERELRHFAELQTDSALLFEGVNNAIKLIGDQHLARVYVVASDRLNLPQWDASVLRKLGVAESVYQKLSDAAGNKRMEILEWIIIILILVSIVMPFLGIKY